MNERVLKIASIIISIFLLLVFRLFYITNKYNSYALETVYKYNIKEEQLQDINFQLNDCNGVNLFEFNKVYMVHIDIKPFKLNSTEQNLKSLLAFEYIMQREVKDFSYKSIFEMSNNSKNPKYNFSYEISEEGYSKINKITGLRGVYTSVEERLKNNEPYRIENIITNFYDKNKNKLKEKGTLERTIYDFIKDNDRPVAQYKMNTDGEYYFYKDDLGENNLNIKLTLDSKWQNIARTVLRDTKYKGLKNVGIVIVESKTGKVKALAQKDENVPNILIGSDLGSYSPGSAFKMVTEELAYEKNLVDDNELFYCNGSDCPEAHGYVNIHDAFALSCNYTFQQIGKRMGAENIIDFAKKQGLFSKVLGMAEESSGVLPSGDLSYKNIAIGHTFNVTPIQMAGIVSTIVNGGIYQKPYILEAVVENDGRELKLDRNDSVNVINRNTALNLKSDLRRAVFSDKATGYNARIEGIDLGGKTGTAEVKINELYHGWFAGYFSLNNQNYSMVVMAPDIRSSSDDKNKSGNTTCAPIFKDIVTELIKLEK